MELEATRAASEAAASAKAGNLDSVLQSLGDELRKSPDDTRQLFVSEFTKELHRSGSMPSVVRAYAQAHFKDLDLDKDGHITSDELNKVLTQDIYARALNPLQKQLVRYMKVNNQEMADASNDDWGSEIGITKKDLIEHDYKSAGRPKSVNRELLAKTEIDAKIERIADGQSKSTLLPDLILELGQKHFQSLDANKNGYITRDELRSVLNSPQWSRTLTVDEKKTLTEMDNKYEQIERSSSDEFWYKDRKGITIDDLKKYAKHQADNRREMPSTPGDHNVALTIGGIKRETTVHIPPGYNPDKPSAVVYAFHYFAGTPDKMAEYSELNAKADKENFIVVYPTAVGWLKDRYRQWNLDNKPSYRVDEVAFVSALMDKVENDLKIDKECVYVAGYSNGGMLAQEIATKLSPRIAAFACVSGCLTGNESKPERPVPALLIHGTEDHLVPYEGRRFTPLFPRMKSLSYSRDFWKSCNATNETTVTEPVPGVQKETHVNKQTGNDVVVYTLKGNGHGWPGSTESIDGKPCTTVRGADLVWDFLSRHKRSKP